VGRANDPHPLDRPSKSLKLLPVPQNGKVQFFFVFWWHTSKPKFASSHLNLGFFDHGMTYTAPSLMGSNGNQLSQRGKRIFAQELAGLIDRALN